MDTPRAGALAHLQNRKEGIPSSGGAIPPSVLVANHASLPGARSSAGRAFFRKLQAEVESWQGNPVTGKNPDRYPLNAARMAPKALQHPS